MIQITEVYVYSSKHKAGEQWFEVLNNSKQTINLKNARVRRLDGKKKKEAWRLNLEDKDNYLEPSSYGVIAEQKDLGQNLCSDYLVIEVPRKIFSLKSTGIQEICIMLEGYRETCEKFSDSSQIKPDFSRNLFSGFWLNEICELRSGLFASPGLANYFCQKNTKSLWEDCPEDLSQFRQIHKPNVGCGSVNLNSNNSYNLIFLGLMFFLIIRQRVYRSSAKRAR